MSLSKLKNMDPEVENAQVAYYNAMTKECLWRTEIISQEDAARLLEISVENLRQKGTIFKSIRSGNKSYYSTSQLKQALTKKAKEEIFESNIDKKFKDYL